MITITKEFTFDTAHLLENHSGKCANLHGHTYRLLITVSSQKLNEGMIIDFGDLKNIVNHLFVEKIDHSLIYNINSNEKFVLEIANILKKNNKKVYEVSFRTTCEEMSRYIYNLLKEPLNNVGILLLKIELYEGEKSHATYDG